MKTINQIKEFIKSLDVDIIGYTKPDIDEWYVSNLKTKLSNKKLYPRHGDLQKYYDASKVIYKPTLVISIGLGYHQNYHQITNKYFGCVSQTSYGIDYHIQLYKKLNIIKDYLIESYPQLNAYLSCDTKEIDDRYYAYLCGNGFYGKNSMIINPTYGSEVFYGTLICDYPIDISKAKPLTSKCGSCKICEASCPSSSLKNYQLDYKTCLSHLSQTKEMIGPEVLNHRLYGCDVCNKCCPFNNKAPISKHFSDDLLNIDLWDVVTLSNREYNKYFENKSLLWLNKNIIRKNAIINLAHYKNSDLDKLVALANKMKGRSVLLDDAFKFILEEDT